MIRQYLLLIDDYLQLDVNYSVIILQFTLHPNHFALIGVVNCRLCFVGPCYFDIWGLATVVNVGCAAAIRAHQQS